MHAQKGGAMAATSADNRMNRMTLTVFVIFIALIGTGVVFLATWDIPPPSKSVEKVLDDGRFPR
jgi:hypothetical protein